jgi:hypothetical protein
MAEDPPPFLRGGGMTLAEMDKLVADWVNSPKGQRELKAAEKAARAAADQVMSDARVTPEQMRRPCTI